MFEIATHNENGKHELKNSVVILFSLSLQYIMPF